MEQDELEEKVTMAEELILGLVKRMEVIESELPGFLKSFLQQYKETLANISGQIEKSNKRYDDQKISQQIDQVKDLVGTIPKIITVKNEHHHHFGAWSKNLIIGVAACFLITASSVGTALYLNHRNNRLNSEAYNYWLVRAMYPVVSKTIEKKLRDDPNGFIEKAEKEMAKQNSIMAAKYNDDRAKKKRQSLK
ncbi:hypothetical protein [Pedobacter sp. GR22-10]|uniref:hypothetical protein n=1 Tax=Pedobacter sp. GR22-10 TaxID=2994472 RepID=UPI0022458732|nr:hypothetical protein [Pedobacter sp. GR22-10]MCX2430650.1 hypothetical protein [Pedobacter sp. GR22-10]